MALTRRTARFAFSAMCLALLCILRPSLAAEPLTPTRTIIFGGDAHFAPLESLDSSGKPVGFHIDMINAIGRVMGRPVEVRLGTWHEIKQEFVDHQIDVVGMADVPGRRLYASFSTPLTLTGPEIFIRAGSAPISGASELSGMDIVVEAGGAVEDWLQEHVPGAKLTGVPTQADAILALAAGRHDCAIVSSSIGRYTVRSEGLRSVTTTGPFLYITPYAFCVAPDRPGLLLEIDAAIESLKQSGEYGRIYDRWLGQIERPAIPLKTALRYGGLIAAGMLCVLLGVLLWSRSLRLRVEARTRELREQLAVRERLEAQQSIMMSELDHRVKNSLAAVLGLAEGMIAENPAPRDFHTRFSARVCAMAKAHEALADSRWEGAPLADAIRAVLEPYSTFGSPRRVLECGDITLTPLLNTPICLSLHELAVNAATHGALRDPRGELTVTAAQTSDGHIEITWRESPTTLTSIPTFGYGLNMVVGLIEFQARGRFSGTIENGAIIWRLRVPPPAPNTPNGAAPPNRAEIARETGPESERIRE